QVDVGSCKIMKQMEPQLTGDELKRQGFDSVFFPANYMNTNLNLPEYVIYDPARVKGKRQRSKQARLAAMNRFREFFTHKEKSNSDSISPQDTETKQWLQKLAPVLGKGERHNTKAAIRLVSSRINQKPKDYDALCLELDEDHIKALSERSRLDLTPFNIVMPPRIVDGERSPQIGGLVRNLVAVQCTGIMAIESIFKKSKEEAAERMFDMFELVSQAIGEAQQLQKQNINFRSNQFCYNRSPVSAALSPKDKKAWKENKSISMNTSHSQS
ncbi:MAG: hypothetical protein EZS28_001148, partial [Streblomastix strix]